MAEPALKQFADNDEFLRRVRFADHIKNGLVHWRAFKDNDVRMSWTFRDEVLRSEVGLREYHEYWNERIGTPLPAILWFSFHGLTKQLDPPLVPRTDPVPVADDPRYGHLHCSTQAPRDKGQMQLLAKLVNDAERAGIARRCVQ